MVKQRTSLDDIFGALSDPTRRMILYQLALGERLNVSEIAKPHHMSLVAVSKHLKVLEAARIVTHTKKGNQYIFSLKPEPFREAEDYIAQYKKNSPLPSTKKEIAH